MSFYTNNMNMSERYRFQRIIFDEYAMIMSNHQEHQPWFYMVTVNDTPYLMNNSRIPSNVSDWMQWMDEQALSSSLFENVSLTLEEWHHLAQQRDVFLHIHALTHCSIEDFLYGDVYEEIPLLG